LFKYILVSNESGNGELVILNNLGEIVRQWELSGEIKVIWNGKSEDEVHMPSGTYLYQMTFGDTHQTGKIILIK